MNLQHPPKMKCYVGYELLVVLGKLFVYVCTYMLVCVCVCMCVLVCVYVSLQLPGCDYNIENMYNSI